MERTSKIKYKKHTQKFTVSPENYRSSSAEHMCHDIQYKKKSATHTATDETFYNPPNYFPTSQNSFPMLRNNLPFGVEYNYGANFLANNIVGYNPYFVNIPTYFTTFQPNFFNAQLVPNAPFVPFINEEKYFANEHEQNATNQKPQSPRRKRAKVCRRKSKRVRAPSAPEDRGDGNFGEVRDESDSKEDDRGVKKSASENEVTTLFKNDAMETSSNGTTTVLNTQEPNRYEFWENLEINNIPKAPVNKQKMDEYLSQVLVEILGSNSHITEMVKKKHKGIKISNEAIANNYICNYMSCYNGLENASVVTYVTAKITQDKEDKPVLTARQLCYTPAEPVSVKKVQKDVVRLHKTISTLHYNLFFLYFVIFLVLLGNILLIRYCRECH